MSYSNGLGNLQHLLGNLATNASRTSTANQPSVSTTGNISPATLDNTDHANLSSASGLISQSASTSDVRLNKVVALQQVIASGAYSIPASAVADSIINSLLS